jgi:radical SAM protein with 4Fe4S-binding SPASM domain
MECPHIEESSGFLERLKAKTARQRLLLSVSLELTFRCNLRCVHCYLGEYRNGIPNMQEMSAAEIRNLINQITDAGCLWLLLTGGEPLVRPDFLEIYTYAKRKGLLITLFTNGTLVTPQLADALAEIPPFATEITLYGASQETYERVTGIPGSYSRCLRGIELLLQRGIPLKLKTMVMNLNQHELQAMKDFAQSLNLDFRFDPLLNAGLDGSKSPLLFRLSPERAVQYDLEDPVRFHDWKEVKRKSANIKLDDRYLYLCGAGLNSFHIDPYGRMSVCLMSREVTYDLRQRSFKEGWDPFLPQTRSQPSKGYYACANCEQISLCGQCPGWATLENSNPQQPVEYLCQVAHLRAKRLGFS